MTDLLSLPALSEHRQKALQRFNERIDALYAWEDAQQAKLDAMGLFIPLQLREALRPIMDQGRAEEAEMVAEYNAAARS